MGTGDVTLGNTANNFANVAIASARDVTLYEAGGFDLAASTVSGNLRVTSTGAITDSGNLSVAGLAAFETRLNAGAAITLNSAGNNYGSVSALARNGANTANAAGAITLLEASAMNIAGLQTTSTAALTANGAITQGGVMTVGTTATLNAGAGNDIELDNAANNFGTVAVSSGRNVTLVDVNAMNVGVSTVAGTLSVTANGAVGVSGAVSAGNLSVTTGNGAITQAAVAVAVSGTTSLSTGSGAITLSTATNNFNVVNATGGAVALRDANALVLGNVAATGALTVTTAGAVTQAANTTVSATGTATFNVGAGNNLTLDNVGNNFGNVAITTANNVVLREGNALAFAGGTSTVSGNLTVVAGGAITQASQIVASAGVSRFDAGTNDIVLTNAANNFGTVGASGANVSLRDTNAVVLGNVAATGALTLTTAGVVTQAANTTVTAAGQATFNTGTGALTLANDGNDFGVVRVVAAGATSLRDANALEFGGGATSVTGALTVTTANATVSQSSSVAATGLATFNVGTGDVTLGNTANNFASIAVTGAGNLTLTDTGGLTLSGANLSGALQVSTTGTLTVSSAVTAGSVSATAVNSTANVAAGIDTSAAGGSITFNTGTGAYTQGNVDLLAGAGNITIQGDTFTLAANTGNNAFQTSGALSLRPSSLARTLTVGGAAAGQFDVLAAELNAFMPGLNTAGGSLVIGRTDSTAALTVGAAHSFGAGSKVTLAAGSIGDANTTNRALTADNLALYANNGTIGGATLNNAIDVVAGNLNVSSNGQSAYVRSTGALNFGYGNSTLGAGSLGVTASGAITQATGTTITAGGTTTLSAGAGNTITLSGAGNDFGTVLVTGTGNATLVDQNAMNIGASTLSGNLTVTTTGNLGFSGAVSAANLSATTNNGAVTQSAAMTISGTASMNAGAGGTVTLGHASNSIAGFAAPQAQSATLTTTGPLVLRASSVLGNFSVTAGGAVTQSAALTVGGATLVTATGNPVTLSDAGNDFASIGVTGSNVTLRDANGLVLAASTVLGNLSVTTGGKLTQSAALSLPGLAAFDTGTSDLQLDNASNSFAGNVSVAAAGNVALASSGDLRLGTINAAQSVRAVSGANLVLNGVVTAQGAGTAIAVSAAQRFINNAGAAALAAPSGRWLAYSADPSLNTYGGLASGNVAYWNATYTGLPPSSVSQAGNRYLFTTAQAVTLTSYGLTKTYGDDVTATLSGQYNVGGLSTATYGGAILADTLAAITSGAVSVTSAGAAAGAGVAGSPYAVSIANGTLASLTGYSVNLVSAGTVAVNPASLSITASDVTRPYGSDNPPFSAVYSGLKAGDAPSALGGALQFTTSAEKGSPMGRYTLTPAGQSSANYTISYFSGVVNVNSTGVQVREALGDVMFIGTPAGMGVDMGGGGVSLANLGTVTALASLVSTDDPDLLNQLEATAAGPDGGLLESLQGPRRFTAASCGGFTPAALLRCRR